ncbi:MAG: hypothetical protein AAF235_04775 [Planctomycetota bacterium]
MQHQLSIPEIESNRRLDVRRRESRRAGLAERYGEALTVRSTKAGVICRPRLVSTQGSSIIAYFPEDMFPPEGEELHAIFRGSRMPLRVSVERVDRMVDGTAIAGLRVIESRRRSDRRGSLRDRRVRLV